MRGIEVAIVVRRCRRDEATGIAGEQPRPRLPECGKVVGRGLFLIRRLHWVRFARIVEADEARSIENPIDGAKVLRLHGIGAIAHEARDLLHGNGERLAPARRRDGQSRIDHAREQQIHRYDERQGDQRDAKERSRGDRPEVLWCQAALHAPQKQGCGEGTTRHGDDHAASQQRGAKRPGHEHHRMPARKSDSPVKRCSTKDQVNKLDREQQQCRCEEHVLGYQHAVIRICRHECDEAERHETRGTRRAHDLGDAKRPRDCEDVDYPLKHRVDEYAEVLAACKRDARLNAEAYERRMQRRMVLGEQHARIEQIDGAADMVGQPEPLQYLRVRVPHEKRRSIPHEHRKPAQRQHKCRGRKRMPIECAENEVRCAPQPPARRRNEPVAITRGARAMRTEAVQAFEYQLDERPRGQQPPYEIPA